MADNQRRSPLAMAAVLAAALATPAAASDCTDVCSCMDEQIAAGNVVTLERYDPGFAHVTNAVFVLVQNYFDTSDVPHLVQRRFDNPFADVGPGAACYAEGYIVLGKPYLDSIRSAPGGHLILTALLAHENAHVFQYRGGYFDQLVDQGGYFAKLLELHADYMAGAVMANMGIVMPLDPKQLQVLIWGFGDNRFDNKLGHHGTAAERAIIFSHGMRDANAAAGVLPLRDASERGFNHVRPLLDQ